MSSISTFILEPMTRKIMLHPLIGKGDSSFLTGSTTGMSFPAILEDRGVIGAMAILHSITDRGFRPGKHCMYMTILSLFHIVIEGIEATRAHFTTTNFI